VLTQPAWIKATNVNPVMDFAAAQIPYTNYRPALPAYLEISNEIALLTGEISSGSITAQQAATQYATTVTGIVGSANVERRST
jgi:maltose-binding protein MalE